MLCARVSAYEVTVSETICMYIFISLELNYNVKIAALL
jgi:hypothetical protein